MTVAYSDFVAAFPEFADQERFPASGVDFWIAQADNQINCRRFGKLESLAVMLFTAHNLVLGAQNQRAAAKGIPGVPMSPIASKTVGEVSVSYDTKDTVIEGAGAWNATSYGQRLYTMMKAVGTGPVYRVPPRRVSPW